MTLLQQPQTLSQEESAFAAEHFPKVYAFLNENGLSEDIYYDSAINGFLKAVRHRFRTNPTKDFAELSTAFMSRECDLFDKRQEREPRIISLSECYKSAYEFEERIADTVNTMDEAISAISLEETMQSFTETQKEIVKLLMGGYTQSDIASMLQISMQALYREIGLIQQKTLCSPLMTAA